jgi:hypothetical protein
MQPNKIIDLDTERRIRAHLERAPVCVIRTPDRENANRNFYEIYSATAEAVQSEILAQMGEAESFGNGYAEFINPRRHPDIGLFFSVGVVVVHPDIYPDGLS